VWLAARPPVRLIALTIVAMVAVPVPNAIADSSRPSSRAPKLLALHATRGDQPAIIDAPGRQVILRGVKLNSLGDYYQADRRLQPGRIEVWFPKHSSGGPRVDGARMTRVKVVPVPGGWQISARVDGDFTLRARG
jgi:hypothetical protein